MDVVIVFNGLGNQMSQYALYLAKRHIDLRTSWLYYPDKVIDQHNGYELEKVFGIKCKNTPKSLLGKIYTSLRYSKNGGGKKRLAVKNILRCFGIAEYREQSSMFEQEAMKPSANMRFIWGGWHSEKYFEEVKAEVREAFTFDVKKLDQDSSEILTSIQSSESVSVHVRRGDYVKHSAFDGICTMNYYEEAMKYFEEKVSEPQYFIFSDDTQWAKEHFDKPNMRVVSGHSGNEAWKDMFLMSQCKHNINANSTFSWWAAWLNPNQEKMVIVPSRFNNLNKPHEIYPDSWIKLQ